MVDTSVAEPPNGVATRRPPQDPRLDMATVEELNAQLATVVANQEHMQEQLGRLIDAIANDGETVVALRERVVILEQQAQARREADTTAAEVASRSKLATEIERWALRVGATLGAGGAGYEVLF